MPVYKVPFTYPSPDVVPTAYLRDLLKEHNVTLDYDFDAPHDGDAHHQISGGLDDLTYFMMDIMCEVTRDYFDANEWRKIAELYEVDENGIPV